MAGDNKNKAEQGKKYAKKYIGHLFIVVLLAAGLAIYAGANIFFLLPDIAYNGGGSCFDPFNVKSGNAVSKSNSYDFDIHAEAFSVDSTGKRLIAQYYNTGVYIDKSVQDAKLSVKSGEISICRAAIRPPFDDIYAKDRGEYVEYKNNVGYRIKDNTVSPLYRGSVCVLNSSNRVCHLNRYNVPVGEGKSIHQDMNRLNDLPLINSANPGGNYKAVVTIPNPPAGSGANLSAGCQNGNAGCAFINGTVCAPTDNFGMHNYVIVDLSKEKRAGCSAYTPKSAPTSLSDLSIPRNVSDFTCPIYHSENNNGKPKMSAVSSPICTQGELVTFTYKSVNPTGKSSTVSGPAKPCKNPGLANSATSSNIIENHTDPTGDTPPPACTTDFYVQEGDLIAELDPSVISGDYALYTNIIPCVTDGTYSIDSSEGNGRLEYLLVPEASSNPNSPNFSKNTVNESGFLNREHSENGQYYTPINTKTKGGYVWLRIFDGNELFGDNSGKLNVNLSFTSTTHIMNGMGSEANGDSITGKVITLVTKPIESATYKIMNSYAGNTSFANYIRVAVLLGVMGYLMMYVAGMVELDQHDLIVRLVKVAIVLALISPTPSNFIYDSITNLYQNGTNYITNSLYGVSNPGVKVTNPFLQFEQYLVALFTFENILRLTSLLFMPIFGWFILFIVGNALTIYIKALIHAFSFYIVAKLMLCFLAAVAPLMISFILFKQTQEFAKNWFQLFTRYLIEPVILLTAINVLNELVIIHLFSIFSFSICLKCAIPFLNGGAIIAAIPGLNAIASMFANYLFCFKAYLPFGYDPIAGLFSFNNIAMSYSMLVNAFLGLIACKILSKISGVTVTITGFLTKQTLGGSPTSAPSSPRNPSASESLMTPFTSLAQTAVSRVENRISGAINNRKQEREGIINAGKSVHQANANTESAMKNEHKIHQETGKQKLRALSQDPNADKHTQDFIKKVNQAQYRLKGETMDQVALKSTSSLVKTMAEDPRINDLQKNNLKNLAENIDQTRQNHDIERRAIINDALKELKDNKYIQKDEVISRKLDKIIDSVNKNERGYDKGESTKLMSEISQMNNKTDVKNFKLHADIENFNNDLTKKLDEHHKANFDNIAKQLRAVDTEQYQHDDLKKVADTLTNYETSDAIKTLDITYKHMDYGAKTDAKLDRAFIDKSLNAIHEVSEEVRKIDSSFDARLKEHVR